MKNRKQEILLICSLFLAVGAAANRLCFFENQQKIQELKVKQPGTSKPESTPGQVEMCSGDGLKPGTILEESQISPNRLERYFTAKPITEDIFERISNRSYRENNNIKMEKLRYLTVLHYNFEHKIQVGELIVNAQIADEMCQIFRELFEEGYEIQSLKLIDDYWKGDGITSDEASVMANNSSAFCYRMIAGTEKLSNHALGYAIDINPLQNPLVIYTNGVPSDYPSYSQAYADRHPDMPHVITQQDICYRVFKKYGYIWGGDWSTPKDYQHFEKPQENI